MDAKDVRLQLDLPAAPLRVDVDPEFDVFRRLDRAEMPPAVSQVLGAKKLIVILPSEPDEDIPGYRGLAEAIARSGPDEVMVETDRDMETLPSDRAAVVLGWKNRFAGLIPGIFGEYEVRIDATSLTFGQTEIQRKHHAFVLTGRHPGNRNLAIMFMSADLKDSLSGLGRKLPHYHKYSYLAFEGPEPENVAKGRWPVVNSPLTVWIQDGTRNKAERARLAKREPLASLPDSFSQERMMETVRFLTMPELQGRGFGTRGLDHAAEYIAKRFAEVGLKPGADGGGWFQEWEEKGGDPEQTVRMRNVIGIIPGRNADMEGESVVIGAHYDHLGRGWPDVRKEFRGMMHPGADDNASGVAVLLELAAYFMHRARPDRAIVFVAFTGEEAGRRGSRRYVSEYRDHPAGKAIGMINIDTVGRMEENRLLVLGGGSAREWVHIFRGAGFVTGTDITMVTEDLDASDQISFHEAGVPAVQLFTGPHTDYHRPTDTADKISVDGLVQVASVGKEAIEYLAKRTEPLTAVIAEDGENGRTRKARRVSLGTMPDFTYAGEGYRLAGVIPSSPAEASGLKEGDVIVSIDGEAVRGLRDLSRILKSLSPGDAVTIIVERDNRRLVVETTVTAR